jgi:hypothetical protein
VSGPAVGSAAAPTWTLNTLTPMGAQGLNLLRSSGLGPSARAVRTPAATTPAVPNRLPPAPAPSAGTTAGAGSAGTFFAFAVLLAMLALGVPRLVGRRRLFRELGRPTPFRFLLADPG